MSEEKVFTLKLAEKPKEAENTIADCEQMFKRCLERMAEMKFDKVMVLMLSTDDEQYSFQFNDYNLRHSEKLSLLDVVHDHILRRMMTKD